MRFGLRILSVLKGFARIPKTLGRASGKGSVHGKGGGASKGFPLFLKLFSLDAKGGVVGKGGFSLHLKDHKVGAIKKEVDKGDVSNPGPHFSGKRTSVPDKNLSFSEVSNGSLGVVAHGGDGPVKGSSFLENAKGGFPAYGRKGKAGSESLKTKASNAVASSVTFHPPDPEEGESKGSTAIFHRVSPDPGSHSVAIKGSASRRGSLDPGKNTSLDEAVDASLVVMTHGSGDPEKVSLPSKKGAAVRIRKDEEGFKNTGIRAQYGGPFPHSLNPVGVISQGSFAGKSEKAFIPSLEKGGKERHESIPRRGLPDPGQHSVSGRSSASRRDPSGPGKIGDKGLFREKGMAGESGFIAHNLETVMPDAPPGPGLAKVRVKAPDPMKGGHGFHGLKGGSASGVKLSSEIHGRNEGAGPKGQGSTWSPEFSGKFGAYYADGVSSPTRVAEGEGMFVYLSREAADRGRDSKMTAKGTSEVASASLGRAHRMDPGGYSGTSLRREVHVLDTSNRELFFERISHVVSTVSEKGGRVTLNLHPPHLGKLRIVVGFKGDVLNLRFVVETKEARDLLESGMVQLRNMLGQGGMQVGRIVVAAGWDLPEKGGRFWDRREGRNGKGSPASGGEGHGSGFSASSPKGEVDVVT